MFNETSEGQTHSCTHTEDGSVCPLCLGGSFDWNERLPKAKEAAKKVLECEEKEHRTVADLVHNHGEQFVCDLIAEAERRAVECRDGEIRRIILDAIDQSSCGCVCDCGEDHVDRFKAQIIQALRSKEE